MSAGLDATSAVAIDKAEGDGQRESESHTIVTASKIDSVEQHKSNGLIPESRSGSNEVPEHPVENFRRMKVIVIGAGFSGIYMGIRIPERLRNVDLTIYEKNDGYGGTWWENSYPGMVGAALNENKD